MGRSRVGTRFREPWRRRDISGTRNWSPARRYCLLGAGGCALSDLLSKCRSDNRLVELRDKIGRIGIVRSCTIR
jgi:hypothetical protein